MEQSLNQLFLLMNGAQVTRFHTVPTIKNESVGHHSMLVAGLAFILWPDRPHLLPHAIVHDLPEVVTGDMPSPGKRAYGDRTALKTIEGEIINTAGFTLPALSDEDAACLKVCDILAGMVTCYFELRMGNRLVTESMENYRSYLKEMGPHSKQVCAIANELYKVISNT